jgi:hypothetical protein
VTRRSADLRRQNEYTGPNPDMSAPVKPVTVAHSTRNTGEDS